MNPKSLNRINMLLCTEIIGIPLQYISRRSRPPVMRATLPLSILAIVGATKWGTILL